MTNSSKELQDYYDLRADEYEQIYQRDDPVRQGELAALKEEIRMVFAGRDVLEVACGTGYWTEVLSEVAAFVLAIDSSPRSLRVARKKAYPQSNVRFRQFDAFRLSELPGRFMGGLANFWLSHIPKSKMDEFLTGFHRKLTPGSPVFMVENVLIPGLGGDLVKTEGEADSYKLRKLDDGSEHRILKNYYNEHELQGLFTGKSDDLNIEMGQCFWWISYKTVERISHEG